VLIRKNMSGKLRCVLLGGALVSAYVGISALSLRQFGKTIDEERAKGNEVKVFHGKIPHIEVIEKNKGNIWE